MLEQSSPIPRARLEKTETQTRRLAVRVDWPALAAFGLPMLLYVLTAAPTIFNLDSAEFTTAVASGGIVRATGYPLYLLLGKLWLWLPLAGDVGHRMNLFSAFWGAVTLLLADRILRRLDVDPWARLGALGLLAASPYFWGLSLIAEVYTLHTGLMAGILLLLLAWAERPSPGRLAWPVLLMALSAGNHAATALLIPGAVWFVVTSHPRQLLRPRVWIVGGLALLVGHIHVDNWMDFLFVLGFLALGLVLLGRKRWSEATFVLLGAAIPFGSGLLMSQRRYMWVLFPAFILLAQWGRRPWVDRAITVLFLLGLALYTALFANGYWVG